MKKNGVPKVLDDTRRFDLTIKGDSIVNFSWETPDGVSISGYDSIQELFCSVDFLEKIQLHLGEDSVPKSVIKHAREYEAKNAGFPDGFIEEVVENFSGIPVVLVDQKKKKGKR